jgi:hypothetical protein
MKKLLVLLAALVFALGAALWIGGAFVDRTYAKRTWPAGLGELREAAKRYPPAAQNEAATKLVALAAPAKIDLAPKTTRQTPPQGPARDREQAKMREELANYLRVQFERKGDAIDPLPPLAAQFLTSNAATFDAVRDHLLSGQRIVWHTDLAKAQAAPMPNLYGHMHLQRALIARALDKARAGDPSAWNELRASWELNRGLWNRPELISLLVALATTRMSNAAARKMPLPAPEWLAETYAFDYTRQFLRAQQAEAWMLNTMRPAQASGPPILRHVRQLVFDVSIASTTEKMRRYAEEAARTKACDTTSPQFAAARAVIARAKRTWWNPAEMAIPNLIGAWSRVLRFEAEVEATERILQLRAGLTPSPKSQCSDGSWSVTANSIRFSRDPDVPEPGIVYPLEYAR